MANSPTGDSSLDRVLRILEAFDASTQALTVGALARRADLPQATAYRIVDDMARRGFLDRQPTGEVRPGLRLWELVTRCYRARELREAALPFIQDVQSVVHQHTQLAVLQDDEVLVLERLSSPTSVINQASVANRLPVHDTSLGMSMLAFSPSHSQARYSHEHAEIDDRFDGGLRGALAEIRTRGYAVLDGALDEGTTGIAVPVLDRSKLAVASIGVVVPTGTRRHTIVAVLSAAARGIARATGNGPDLLVQ
ncbi:IclR family transcriptional regulator [Rhodococcus erythropolis]|uniref:IclR family transcriptional regulator n=1 Tax=Rhodococcus erythropolis TaxID=1833 RepID=UPI0002E815D0|nr:IclR family transcriptional regulator [Rhodococcus erythropolis]